MNRYMTIKSGRIGLEKIFMVIVITSQNRRHITPHVRKMSEILEI
jgi:hypothetical protein